MFVKAAKVSKKIEVFPIQFNEEQKLLIKYCLIYQKNKLLNKLKQMQKEGLIKSIKKPKSKSWKVQKEIKEIVMANRILTASIEKLKNSY